MKRKSIILLSSILAGSLLVGGAFAATAALSVFDNADQFGINVTPGNLDADETTYITLKWGESTKLSGVGNIKVNENRKVGVVSLQSSETYEDGVFTVRIGDNTPAAYKTGHIEDYLLDYLNVYIYKGAQSLTPEGGLPVVSESVVKVGQITKSTAKGSDGKKTLVLEDVTGTAAGEEYSIFVNLDNSVSSVFSSLNHDKVYLDVDWSPKAGDEATGSLVYFNNTEGWDAVYAYAWVDDKVNAQYPGVKMAQYNGNIYMTTLPAVAYKNIVFNNGADKEDVVEEKTVDIPMAGYNASDSPYYDGESWVARPEIKDYYLLKEVASVWTTSESYKFSINPTNVNEYVLEGVTLEDGDKVKVAHLTGASALTTSTPVIPATGNPLTIDAGKGGVYNLYFSATPKDDWASDKTYGNAYGYAKYMWVVPQGEAEEVIPQEDKLEINVALGEYANDKATCFIFYWGNEVGGFAKVTDGKATINAKYTGLLVVRMPADAASADFESCWNKSKDVNTKGTAGQVLTFDSWDNDGTFSWQ